MYKTAVHKFQSKLNYYALQIIVFSFKIFNQLDII